MTPTEKAEFVRQHLGDAAEIAQELKRFRKSALLLSRERPRMIEEHPQEWIAIYDGKVRASDKSFDRLMGKVDAAGIPRAEAPVRFIDRTGRTMIL